MAEKNEYFTQKLENGTLQISEDVVASVAAAAVLEVDGVCGLSSNISTDIAEMLGMKTLARGVRLTPMKDGVVKIECDVVAKFGQSVFSLAKTVQDAVKTSVESVAGLTVAQVNVNIMKDIASKIVPVAPNALYVIVSNPVDVLTYVFHKVSGVPENHIIGSGTILDTSRLQAALARRFHISPKNVHAHVYGEHGDSSFVPWSLVHIANNHIDSYRDHSPDKDSIEWNGPADYADMEEFVKKSGAQVIKNKGATFYAVAVSVCHLCKCLQSTAGTALTVSTLMHGEYGVDDVCLSTLALVDRTGVRGKILNHLTEDEIAKLRHSAECLRTVIGNVEI